MRVRTGKHVRRRPDLRQEADDLAGKVAHREEDLRPLRSGIEKTGWLVHRGRHRQRWEAVWRSWLARTTFFGGVPCRRFVWRLSIGWGTHLLAGKLCPGSVSGLLIGMTGGRRWVAVRLRCIGVLRQRGRCQRKEGSHRTNEDRFCDPHMRFSFWNGNYSRRKILAIFCRAIEPATNC